MSAVWTENPVPPPPLRTIRGLIVPVVFEVGPAVGEGAILLLISVPDALAALNGDLGFRRDLLRRSRSRLAAALVGFLATLGFLLGLRLSRRRFVEFIAPCPCRLLRRAASLLPLLILDPAFFDERYGA